MVPQAYHPRNISVHFVVMILVCSLGSDCKATLVFASAACLSPFRLMCDITCRSSGIPQQIQAIIAPPHSAEERKRLLKEKEQKGQRRHGNRNGGRNGGKTINRDCCDSCHEGGDLLCCDRCPASFHFQCWLVSILVYMHMQGYRLLTCKGPIWGHCWTSILFWAKHQVDQIIE